MSKTLEAEAEKLIKLHVSVPFGSVEQYEVREAVMAALRERDRAISERNIEIHKHGELLDLLEAASATISELKGGL